MKKAPTYLRPMAHWLASITLIIGINPWVHAEPEQNNQTIIMTTSHQPSPSFEFISPIYEQLSLAEKQTIVTVLVIDGGGVFGIMPAQILAEIENVTGQTTSSLFDQMTGTSTGAILITGLATPNTEGTPRYSAEDMINLYKDDSQAIFYSSLWHDITSMWGMLKPKFSNKNITAIADELYGNTTFSQLLTNATIPCGVLLDESPYWFNSMAAKKNPNDDFFVKDAVVGATATPGLFEPYLIYNINHTWFNYCVDGGAFINNPTLQAYFDAKQSLPKNTKFMLVSIGTGIDAEKSDLTNPEIFENMGVLKGAFPAFEYSLHMQAVVIDEEIRRLAINNPNTIMAYYRFNIKVKKDEFSGSSYYDGSSTNIRNIEKLGNEMIEKNDKSINKLIIMLNEIKGNDSTLTE